MSSGKNADEFRSLDEVFLADPRQQAHGILSVEGVRPIEIKDYHAALTRFRLNLAAPHDVRIGFDTARNLCLYSWCVYRFQATAELQAYATLELAIRLRVGSSEAQKGKKSGLGHWFDVALKRKWFKDTEMRYYQKLIEKRKRARESTGWMERQLPPSDPEPDAWVHGLKKSFPALRNEMAHGTPILMGNTIEVLEICCDLINQLFPEEAP